MHLDPSTSIGDVAPRRLPRLPVATDSPLRLVPGIEAIHPPAAPAPCMPERSARDRQFRTLNLIVATLGMVLSLPLMLVVALLVKVTSPGPVLYRQPRVGLDRRRTVAPGIEHGCRLHDMGGRIFTIYKFRTMRPAPSKTPPGEQWATADDPRITPLGSVLRRHRLDELPQLLNVLRGEMSVVGPRPEQPAIFAELRSKIADYPKRQAVPPGITGWAQVNHGYDRSLDDVRRKVEYDLEYIHRRSPSEDLQIMARTLPVMIWRRGAH